MCIRDSSGTSNGWQAANHLIEFNNGNPVIFRFMFGSDLTVANEGWAIDDFCFEEYSGPCNISAPEQPELEISQALPNPANANTGFEIYMPNAEELNLRVVNTLGQVVMQETSFLNQGNNSVNLDLRNLNMGIYYVHFTINEESTIRKVVVDR